MYRLDRKNNFIQEESHYILGEKINLKDWRLTWIEFLRISASDEFYELATELINDRKYSELSITDKKNIIRLIDDYKEE